ncbi:hypothetical protein F5884DRAFT_185959 [Xylogone sp. PMI_703]|nr:hypothetical protein F5884DRAFT_185959 [Xylogone sp. PMI_703]
MSLTMSDHIDLENSGLQEVANAIRAEATAAEATMTPSQKRKRGVGDNGSPDDVRRTNNKRMSQNNSVSMNDGSDQGGLNQENSGMEGLHDYSGLQDNSENQNGSTDHANASSTAAAALAGIYPTMTIPQPTDVSFATQVSEGDRNQDSSFMNDSQQGDNSFMENSTPSHTHAHQPSTGRAAGNKPVVGSDEWHKVRKDNHKEVERRRRETINEGINELAKIVPGCEKNKGSILQRAVAFITQLKENETQNIEKWTLEKLLTEQAIAELSASNDKLKAECERAWREVETWKKTCQSAGLAPKKEDGTSVDS